MPSLVETWANLQRNHTLSEDEPEEIPPRVIAHRMIWRCAAGHEGITSVSNFLRRKTRLVCTPAAGGSGNITILLYINAAIRQTSYIWFACEGGCKGYSGSERSRC